MSKESQRKPRSLTTLCLKALLPQAGWRVPRNISPETLKVKNFDLLKSFSRGAAGQLWLARHQKTRELHVIKFVLKDPSGVSSWYQRETMAYENYQQLTEKNPNLVRILQAGRTDGGMWFFYVMEVADDVDNGRNIQPDSYSPRTLLEVIRQQPISWESMLEWMDGLLSGLAFLHKHLVIHQDLKPSNIIFVAGKPKLADVGLLTRVDPYSVRDSSVGTVGYMAPEPQRTFRSDIYSFGKLAYEMMTGLDRLEYPRLPDRFFKQPDRHRWMALNRIICRACEKDPQVRPANVLVLRKEIQRLASMSSRKRLFFSWFSWPVFRRAIAAN